jgi:hypothetical protein
MFCLSENWNIYLSSGGDGEGEYAVGVAVTVAVVYVVPAVPTRPHKNGALGV